MADRMARLGVSCAGDVGCLDSGSRLWRSNHCDDGDDDDGGDDDDEEDDDAKGFPFVFHL